jgi:hypothetical protein
MSNPTAIFIRSLDCESDRQPCSTANCPAVMVRGWAGTGRVMPCRGGATSLADMPQSAHHLTGRPARGLFTCGPPSPPSLAL